MKRTYKHRAVLTDKPRITAIALHCEVQKVLLETPHWVGLWLYGQSTLHFGLVSVRHKIACAPAVGSDPREGTGSIIPANGSHDAGHFLVGTEDYGSWKRSIKLRSPGDT